MRFGHLHDPCYHLDHSCRQHLPLTGLRVVQCIASQLCGKQWVKSSSRIVFGAAKFVSPIGLHHAVDGGTNCARLVPSNASSMRLSFTRCRLSCLPVVRATCLPFSDHSSKEACEETFDSLLGLEAEKEWVPPAAIPLGAGLDGKS
ncbi:hypothetical protein MHU86_21871 [Fragilaria crotonensis]|nr:hypothetical protein MHU86_21871 [Fragilaria crotonensis]